MKNPFLLLVVCSLLVFFTADIVLAEWQIQYDAEANRVLHLGGQTKRGSFATKEQCEAYRESLPYFERQHSRCVPAGGWSPTPPEGVTPLPSEGMTPQEEQTWAEEEMLRKKLQRKRQKELEREKELFELGKSELLNKLERLGSSQPPGLKGAGGQEGLALKPPPIEQVFTDELTDELVDSLVDKITKSKWAKKQLVKLAGMISQAGRYKAVAHAYKLLVAPPVMVAQGIFTATEDVLRIYAGYKDMVGKIALDRAEGDQNLQIQKQHFKRMQENRWKLQNKLRYRKRNR